MNDNPNNRRFIDVMTVLSCFAVVTLHTNGIFHKHPDGILLLKVTFWHYLFIFGAPAFFMISGATLMDYRKRYDTRTFLIKRLQRTLVPFLFWSLVAFAVHCLIVKDITMKEIILLPLKICACDYMSTYWFFMSIFGGYLFLPAMSLMAERKQLLIYLLCLWFVIESLYPFICGLVGFSICKRIAFPYIGGAVAYMLLGYTLYSFDFNEWLRISLYILGAGSFIVSVVGTMMNIRQIPGTGGYWGPLCVLYTAALFLFLRNRNYTCMSKKIAMIIDWIKPHTLGVYLLHVFVTDIIAIKFNWPISSFVYRVIGPFILITLCVLLSNVINKIPFLRRVV